MIQELSRWGRTQNAIWELLCQYIIFSIVLSKETKVINTLGIATINGQVFILFNPSVLDPSPGFPYTRLSRIPTTAFLAHCRLCLFSKCLPTSPFPKIPCSELSPFSLCDFIQITIHKSFITCCLLNVSLPAITLSNLKFTHPITYWKLPWGWWVDSSHLNSS